MPRAVHFEIQADDAERAVDFYQQVFGWQIEKWGRPRRLLACHTGPDEEPGINGAITHRMNPGTVNTIDVSSVDEFTKKIVDAGGKITVPKRAVPGVGYMAYCEDTEGNLFGIMEENPSAR